MEETESESGYYRMRVDRRIRFEYATSKRRKFWKSCGFESQECIHHEFRILRATDSKYGESNDSSENSDFLSLHQKDPFGAELFSEIYFKSSSELTFFEI